MAITEEAEQACFEAFATLLDADTGTNGLATTTQTAGAYDSNAVLVGNITVTKPALIRVGDPMRNKNFPRMEWESVSTEEADTPAYARVRLLVRLHHYANRETPRGFGSLNNVTIRSRQVFHRAALAAKGGWNFSTLVRKRGFLAPSTEKEQHYIVEYAVDMSAGSAGGF